LVRTREKASRGEEPLMNFVTNACGDRTALTPDGTGYVVITATEDGALVRTYERYHLALGGWGVNPVPLTIETVPTVADGERKFLT
jgi:hypothetical protein